ncbi:MAG: glutaredoxin 3 [Desulfobacterales bacterium CG23_combo_of_CG06-09_8_20_14_all_51_8]|nr:MAG: glutaredoxin 3 [Desulfobacterales bacterium CG23_combo_of_CG06-09_8_20_14_all_51_8]
MVKIDIYTSATCPYCKRAKALLRSKGASFNEFEVDGNPELIAESVKRSNGMRTVPQIFIENFHVGGYDELNSLEKNGKLDSLLGVIP